MAPGFSSSPAPDATIALGESEVGVVSGLSPQLVTVSEIGDETLDVSAITFGGPNAGDFSTTTAPFMIVDGGSDVVVDFECTPSARGDRTGTVELTNNSVNESTPVYNLTCAGLAPNVAVSSTTITLNGVIGQTNPTGSINVTNAQDGFTSDANNAVVNTTTDATEISATSDVLDDATISVDEVDSLEYECSTASPGMFTEVFQIDYDDPISGGTASTMAVTVNCEIINEIPEYESDPDPGVTLDFGQVLNGDTSPALGVDIGNTDNDTVPNGTLEITAATITGPDAGVFTLVTDPTSTMIPDDEAPDGVADAEVTCTPTDGFSTFTATLSIESNDPDDSPADYPLTCDGDTDADLVSDPEPGTVSLGTIGPGGSADTTITLTNTGTSGDITLDSCTLTADPEITLVSPTAFPVDIAPGASTDIVLNCTPGSPGAFTGTLACEASDVAGTLIPLDYDLVCSGQAVEVPTLSRTGLLAMIMALLAVGFIGFRLRQN